MRNLKTLILLALVTTGVLLAALFYRPPVDTVSATERGPLLSDLAKRLDAVRTVAIRHAGETVTLHRKDATWTVAEKADYPAQPGLVRELLLGLTHLQRVEPKTRNPEHYAALGLADLDKTSGKASRIDLKDAADQSLAQVTLGKRQPSTAEPERSDLYALLPGDPQSWRVEGRMPTIGAAGAWLRRTLLELDHSRIAGVTLTHGDGETLRLIPKAPAATPATQTEEARPDAGPETFILEGLGAGETLKSDYILEDIVDRFTRMQLEDVRPADPMQWPEKPDLQVEVQTQDGLRVWLTAAKIDGQPWIRLQAEAPPATAAAETVATSPSRQNAAPTAADAAKGQKETPQQEAATLNARWHGWAYTLADWAYQALDKRRVDLVKAPEVAPQPVASEAGPLAAIPEAQTGDKDATAVEPAAAPTPPAVQPESGNMTAVPSPTPGIPAPSTPEAGNP